MQRLFSLPVFLGSVLALGAAACAGATAETDTEESHVDTSGCSGVDADATRGPVHVRATRPPTAGCWNVQTGGLSLAYTWVQTNDATPAKKDLGFWVGLNGAGTFVKAATMSCRTPTGGVSYGADTSGTQTYECTASAFVGFKDHPELVQAGYDATGHRRVWDVAVAVALDAENHWDSLDGANYHFPL